MYSYSAIFILLFVYLKIAYCWMQSYVQRVFSHRVVIIYPLSINLIHHSMALNQKQYNSGFFLSISILLQQEKTNKVHFGILARNKNKYISDSTKHCNSKPLSLKGLLLQLNFLHFKPDLNLTTQYMYRSIYKMLSFVVRQLKLLYKKKKFISKSLGKRSMWTCEHVTANMHVQYTAT